jgi:hypothetical protein
VTLTVVRHSGASGIKNVVLMPPGATARGAAIQPLPRLPAGRDQPPRTWRPGAYELRFPQFYRFADDELPPGDLQIVVATEAGEERYTVKAQDRDRLR